jgi:hypothetical protein
LTLLTFALMTAASARDCSISKRFRLSHAQRISGVLQDQSGAPLSGLNLELLSGRDVVQHIRTDNSGKYDFREIPVGEYRLHIVHGDSDFCAPRVKCSEQACSIEPQLKVNHKNMIEMEAQGK